VVKTNPQAITPELVRQHIKHAQSRSIGNSYPSGRLMESWKKGGVVLVRYTFQVDSQNCPGAERLLDLLAKELRK